MNKRVEVLNKAKEIIIGNREQQHGSPEDSFNLIAKFWSAYLDKDISPMNVGDMMILLKIARCKTGGHKEDNYIDIAGYAACTAEIFLNIFKKIKAFVKCEEIK